MIEYNFYAVTRVNNDMTSYNDKNDAVANKNAGGGAETCMSLSLALAMAPAVTKSTIHAKRVWSTAVDWVLEGSNFDSCQRYH